MEQEKQTVGETNLSLKPRNRGWLTRSLSRYLSFVNNAVYFRHIYTPGRERMPKDGTPTVLVSNHQNCLIDPLALVFILSDRKPRFLARASVFKNPFFAKILTIFGLLPTYRARVDGVKGVAKNKGTLEEVAKSLSHGETVVLYPEGQHQNKRWLGAFSQAYLKMAFGAAEEANFEREVYVMPTANHYSHYRLPREDMMILFGEPVALSPYYEEYKADPRGVMNKVNDIVRGQILSLMLHVEDLENYAEIDFLRESSYGREWARRQGLNPDYLPEKLESDKSLVAALKRATEEQGERMEKVFEKTKKLAHKIRKMRVREWLFERPRSWVGVLGRVLLLLLGFPIFGASLAATWFVFLAPLVVNRLFVKDRQFKGSINLAVTLLVTYPLCGLVPVVVMLCKGLLIEGLAYLVLFPLMIVFASHYMRWVVQVLAYTRYVFVLRKKAKKVNELRREIYNELDEILK